MNRRIIVTQEAQPKSVQFYSGDHVLQLLIESKMTKAAISRLAGVTPSTISRWISYKEKRVPEVAAAKIKQLEKTILSLKKEQKTVASAPVVLDDPLPPLKYSEEKKDWIKEETPPPLPPEPEPETEWDIPECPDASDELIDEIKDLKKKARELYFKLDEICDRL